MALTYQDKVQSYIGTYSDSSAISQFLTAGAKIVCDLMPDEKARSYASLSNIVDGGSDITNLRVLEITGDGYRAREISYSSLAQSNDPNSLFYSVPKDPTFYVHDGKVQVVPQGANNIMLALSSPVVLFSDTSILQGIVDYDEPIVLYAAIQCRIRQLETARTTLPVSPTAPNLTADIASMQAALNVDQDIELAQGYAVDIQTQIANYAQALQQYSLDIAKAVHQITFYSASLNYLEKQYQNSLQVLFGVAPPQMKGQNASQ